MIRSPSLHPRHARLKIQKPEVSSTEGSEENEDCDLSFVVHSPFVIRLARRSRAQAGASSFSYSVLSAYRVDGIGEIEGKAAKGSGERVGKGASCKSAVKNLKNQKSIDMLLRT